MAMKKSYYTVNGRIIGESSGGTRTNYLPDALGSVTATVDESGAIINTYRYKPYGAQLSKSGVGADPKFQWVGQWGYRVDMSGSIYVRARTYRTEIATWMSADKRGATTRKYVYVSDSPVTYVDPSGLLPIDDCDFDVPKFDASCINIIPKDERDGATKCIGMLCKALCDKEKREKIEKCLKDQGLLKGKTMECLAGWCSKDNKKKKIVCSRCTYEIEYTCYEPCNPDGRKITLSACADAACVENEGEPEFNVGEIRLCTNWYTHDCKGRLSGNCRSSDGVRIGRTLVHEALHFCSECIPQPDTHQQRLSGAAKCILEVAGCIKKD